MKSSPINLLWGAFHLISDTMLVEIILDENSFVSLGLNSETMFSLALSLDKVSLYELDDATAFKLSASKRFPSTKELATKLNFVEF